MLPQYSNADVVTVSVNNLQGVIPKTVIFSSVYMAEEDTAPPHIMELLTNYCNNNNLPLVIGCDANAHHVAWGSSNINERGEALMDFLASTNLAWCNKGHKPTFITRNRREVLDLTLVTLDIFSKLKEWTVSDKPSLSDHAMITFHFTKTKQADSWYRNVRKSNWKDYKKLLPIEISKILPFGEIRSTQDLDSWAELLTKNIIDTHVKSCPLKKAGNKHDPNPWWNNELSTLRNRTRRLERKAKRTDQETDWDAFRDARNAFKAEIRRTKRWSWRELCEQTEGLPPLVRLYKILKWDSNAQLGSIEKPDGSFTNSPEETLQCMLDVHLGEPEATEPDEERLDQTPIYSEMGNVIFTKERATYAVSQFKPYQITGR